jgi:hypothetical protein
MVRRPKRISKPPYGKKYRAKPQIAMPTVIIVQIKKSTFCWAFIIERFELGEKINFEFSYE